MAEEIQRTLDKLKDLVLPFDKWDSTIESPVLWLNKHIVEKLTILNCKEDQILRNDKDAADISSMSQDEIKWIYLKQCLHFLGELKEMLIFAGLPLVQTETQVQQDLPSPTYNLSSSDKEIISKVVQGVVFLGVVPSLYPGVGLPMQRRSKIYQTLHEYITDEVVNDDKMVFMLKKHQRLLYLSTHLLDLLNLDVFSSIILTKHLGDLLAGLVQVGFSVINVDGEIKIPNNEDTQETTETMQVDKEKVKKELYYILDRIFPPLAIRYLLVLQSTVPFQASTNGSKNSSVSIETVTPKWFQNACGMLLTYLANKPGGAQHVIQGVLNIGQDTQGAENHTTKKYAIIATVISNPVLSNAKYQDLEQYFSVVCPQTLDILIKSQDVLSDETKEARKQYSTIAATCIKHLSERSTILSKRYIFDQIMEPLIRLTQKNLPLKKDSKNIIVEEDELHSCIEQLYIIFVLTNEPLIMFLGILRPIILSLLYVHCKICFGESHLRRKVEKLIVRFLKYSSPTLSMKVLRMFAFSESTWQDGKKDEDKLLSVNQDVVIAPVENGGILALKENYSAEEEDKSVTYSSPSFYLADDEKSIALIDILEYIGSKEMTFKFYLNLLEDLTNLMDEVEPSVDKTSDINSKESNILGLNTKEMEPEDLKYMQTLQNLLEMESELDESMRRVRRRMMVIRLIGLMSEDEVLKDSLLNNSGKMIEFLQCTIHRAAKLCQKREARQKDKEIEHTKTNEDDTDNIEEHLSEITPDEVQSLTTALGLLRNLLVGSNDSSFKYTNIKTSDWDLLQLGLEDLEILEHYHGEKSISNMAGKLRELISMHVSVMGHTKRIRCDADNIRKKTEELNDRLKEFKSLLSQVSSETSEINSDSPNEEGSKKPMDMHVQESNISENQDSLTISQPVESNEVLSLKCLASNVIKNTKDFEE